MKSQFTVRKKNTAIMLLSALTGGLALSADAFAQEASNDKPIYRFKMNIENKVNVPEWIVINYNYTPWVNSGGFSSCSGWQPDPNTKDWGESFQQSRVCQQPQVRNATPILFNPVSQRTKLGDTFEDTRSISVGDYQNNIGTRDFIDGERADAWPEWSNSGAPYDCSVWDPSTSDVRLYEPFTQARDCSQDQTRSRNVYNVWASGAETPKRIDSEEQTITVEQTQPEIGQRDEIDGIRPDTPSPWVDVTENYDCAVWSPSVGGQLADFGQERDCSRDQERTQDFFDVWVSGKETLNRTETHEQTVTRTENRTVGVTFTPWTNEGDVVSCSVWGTEPQGRVASYDQTRSCEQPQTRDRIYTAGGETLSTVKESKNIDVTQTRKNVMEGVVADSWSSWTDTAATVCGAWGAAPDAQTSAFTQTRDCGTAQERKRDTFYTWTHSDNTFKAEETETRTDPTTESRTVTVEWTSWTNKNGVKNCSEWSPEPGSNTSDYTQSRECDQLQVRERIYAASGNELKRVEETQTVRVSQNRLNKMDGLVYSAWSPFADSGAETCGTFSPAVGAQTASFSQSRTCTRPQERTRNVYYSWTYGDNTFKETQTDTGTASRTDSRTVTVTPSSWSIVDKNTYSGWTPEPGTRTSSYTQSRTFKQDEMRTWNYAAGATTLSTRQETRTLDKSETRINTMNGVKNDAWGGWTNTGPISCGAWGPEPSVQDANYQQSRDCGTPQKRERDTFYTWAHSSDTFKETETETRTDGSTQSRAVNVSYTNWVNDGSVESCDAWGGEPGTKTADYTQSRDCQQPQKRERVYKVGGTEIASFEETKRVPVTQTRTNKMEGIAYGSWSSWSNDGALNCGGYSPAPSTQTADFTQTRSCQQPQKRTRATYYKWTYSSNTFRSNETGTQSVPSTQSRTVDVAAGNWSNVRNHTYSAYTPEPGTRTSSYTQSRTYKTDQTRTWTYKAGAETLSTRSESRTIDRTQNRTNTMNGLKEGSWGGWTNTGSISCGNWGPTPSTQTADFSQTRSCGTPQKRERDIFYTWAHSSDTFKEKDTETRTNGSTQSRTVDVSVGGWSAVKNHTYSGWTPEPGTRTSNYTQSRTYKQDQKRTWTYKVGTTTIDTRDETRTVDQSQNRTNSMKGIAYGGWSGWSNNGSLSCGGYSPAPSTQTSDFTQTRSCSQPQKRTRATYYTWDYSSNTYRNTETDTQNVSSTQSRTVDVTVGGWSAVRNHTYSAYTPEPGTRTSSYTQSRNYKQDQKRTWAYKVGSTTLDTRDETRTVNQSQNRTNSMTGIVYGNWSGWSNNGSLSCGNYSPAPSTQTSNFTQTRSCGQPQKRTRATYYGWAHSDNTYRNTETDTQTVGSTQSRTVAVSVGGWSYVRNHTFTGWTPEPGSRTSNYTQSRTYKQDQKRTWTYKAGTTTLDTRDETRTVDMNQSRTNSMKGIAYGGWSGWSNNGSLSCGGYSPAPSTQTSDFTQTRSCSQPQKRTRATYYTWDYSSNTYRNTETDTQNVSSTQSRTVDVTVGGWSAVRNHTYSAYTPEPGTRTSSYTQSRNYKQDQKRTWAYKVGSTTLDTRDETRTVNQSQNRTNSMTGIVYGNWSGWSNNGSLSCGGYSPAPSTQTADFTQTRSCSQPQKRTRPTYYGWAYSDNTPRNTETDTKNVASTQSRTVDVSAGGWTYVRNHTFSGWTPEPGSRSSNYTQSRTYKQDQKRTWTYKVGSTTLDTRDETRTINQSQNRTNKMKGIAYGSWSSWSNNGSLSCGGYSPAAGTQTSNFTQTRSCNQPQKRTRATYYTWDYSSNTYRNTETAPRNVPSTQSRTISVSVGGWTNVRNHSYSSYTPEPGSRSSNYTQSRTYKTDRKRTWTYKAGSSTIHTREETGTIDRSQNRTNRMKGIAYGSWSSWSNNGSLSCGGYSPAAGTQTSNFTQTRSCNQPQKRTRATYYTWDYSSNTYRNTETDTKNVGSTQSRTISVSVSGWSTVRTHSHGTFTPAYGNQTANYTQTRPYKRDVKRTWTYKAGSNTLTTRTENTTWDQTQSRTVAVTHNGWQDVGNPTCGNWTGGSTQTRSCTQPQQVTYVHKVNGTTVHTKTKNGSRNYNQSRTLTTQQSTGAWQRTGYSCTSWTPAQSSYYTFETKTQTQRCTENRKRAITTTTNYSDGSAPTTNVTYQYDTVVTNPTRRRSGTKQDSVVSTETRTTQSQSSANVRRRLVSPEAKYTEAEFCARNPIGFYRSDEYTWSETTIVTKYYYWDTYQSGRVLQRSSTPYKTTTSSSFNGVFKALVPNTNRTGVCGGSGGSSF